MRLNQFMAAIFFLLISTIVYADVGNIVQVQKSLNLYSDPTANAKVLANLKIGEELIPVFQQNGWVKVANPTNGDIGWVKNADLLATNNDNASLQQTTITSSHPSGMQSYIIIQQGNQPGKAYHVDEKGNIQTLSDNQTQAVVNQMKQQQQEMQEQMYRIMSNTWQNFLTTQALFTKLNQQIAAQMNSFAAPIVVIRDDNPTQVTTTDISHTTTKTSAN